jgi:hypothetical protein
MSRALIRRAVALFRSPYAPRQVRRANARKWLASVHMLGDKWLLSRPQQRGHAEPRALIWTYAAALVVVAFQLLTEA